MLYRWRRFTNRLDMIRLAPLKGIYVLTKKLADKEAGIRKFAGILSVIFVIKEMLSEFPFESVGYFFKELTIIAIIGGIIYLAVSTLVIRLVEGICYHTAEEAESYDFTKKYERIVLRQILLKKGKNPPDTLPARRRIREISGLIQPEQSSYRWRFGNLKVGEGVISLKGLEIHCKDLKKANIIFDPRYESSSEADDGYKMTGYVKGKLRIVLVTKRRRRALEEFIYDDMHYAEYEIIDGRIFYHFAEDLDALIRYLPECIKYREPSLETLLRRLDEMEQKKRAAAEKEEAQREKARREEAQREKARREETESRAKNDEIGKAMQLLELEDGFTVGKLRKARNRQIKRFHPDVPGGSEELCQQINAAYDLLEKYVK